MKLSPSCSYAQQQQQEVQNSLHELIYSQSFFLNSLARAVQNNFIRSLQWSIDGRCVCVNKTQALSEFDHYFKLNSITGSSLECYNRLISRLLENRFQLASSCYRLPTQVACYFHPSFNKGSFHVNIQLLSPISSPCLNNSPENILHQRSFYLPQQPQCSGGLPFVTNRFSNGRMRFSQNDYFSGLCPLPLSFQENVRFRSSPCKTYRTVNGLSRCGIKAVPLSFFQASDNSEPSLTCTETTNVAVERESSEDYSDNDVVQTNASEEGKDTGVARDKRVTQATATSLQRKILDLFFNPKQKKQNFVASWLDSCCNREEAHSTDLWNSAILMPSGAKKRSKNLKQATDNNFAIQNSHLVDVFGNAYINWKQLKDRTSSSQEAESESSDLLRLNYSSLYDASIARDILAASREAKQIDAAIESIQS